MSGALRLVAGGLLALVCCYIGLLIKRRYRDRENVYRSALSFARTLKSELSSKKTPIPTVAAEFCAGSKGEFESALSECVSRMQMGNRDMSGIEIKCLKAEDGKKLVACLKDFGGSELSEQIALANRLEELAASRAEECAKDTKRLGNMYFRLLALLGLAIILILA